MVVGVYAFISLTKTLVELESILTFYLESNFPLSHMSVFFKLCKFYTIMSYFTFLIDNIYMQVLSSIKSSFIGIWCRYIFSFQMQTSFFV